MSNKDFFNVKSIKSPYTGIEYELETFDKERNDSILTIITHNSLEKLMHDKLMISDLRTSYRSNFIECNERHTVVECFIEDVSGRRVSSIGESTKQSLDSDIAKKYPSLIAFQRAFDRAIIRYLSLEGRCYSDTEISAIELFDNLPEKLNMEEIKSNEEPIMVTEPPKSEEFSEAVVVNIDDVIEETATEEPIGEEDFNVPVKIGQYRGSDATIPELYNDNRAWFDYMVAKHIDGPNSEIIKKMKRYKEGIENGMET